MLQAQLFEQFQWFHRRPELGNEEVETTGRIREILTELGVEILDLPLKTGLVARVSGQEGPTIALRADIDALPVAEETGLRYASGTPGKMHACGHDFHLTALLGAAQLLHARRGNLKGTALLLFQPAEEIGAGAAQVLQAGALEGVREIYGLHTSPELAPGVIAVSAGANTGAVGGFRAEIHGKGGHASAPEDCVDPIVAAAQFIMAAQTIVSRFTSPFEPVVITAAKIIAGDTWNVIPESALIEGTIRTLGTALFAKVGDQLGEIAKGIALASGTRIDYLWQMGAPSTNNDPVLSDFTAGIAQEQGFAVVPNQPSLGGEDFALYQQKLPGVFFFIGTGGLGQPQAHHPKFAVDATQLAPAAELLAALAARALEREVAQ
ncbi:MAG: amidohydrolase [Oscillospiraceae bacterium]|jgi:amidohydrolase|nr:amidohydrolase [Oscillospiraceae bacterium]